MMFAYADKIFNSNGLSICTPEKFNEMLDSSKTEEVRLNLAALRECLSAGEITQQEYDNKKSEEKKKLPVVSPNAWFKDGHRCIESARPSGLVFVDCDHLPLDVRAYYDSMVSGREVELGILFAALSISEGGLHFILRRPQGYSIKRAAMEFAEKTGLSEYLDKGCFNADRCMYMSTRNQVLYYDEEQLFADYEYEETEDVDMDVRPIFLEEERGGFYNRIISKYWDRHDGEPQEGERHDKVLRLAVQLAAVVNNYGTNGLPNKEVDDICKWAAEKCTDDGMSKEMCTIIREIAQEDHVAAAKKEGMPLYEQLLEELEPNLPVGFREAIYGQPKNLHLPIIAALGPVFGALADGVSFMYDNGRPQYLMLMTLVIGHSGSGKGSVTSVLERWTNPIFEAETKVRIGEQQWRNSSEDKPRPTLPRKFIGSNVTGAAMINLHNNSGGHTLLQVDEELDAQQKFSIWCQNDDIYRKSFDRGMCSVERAGKESISGMVRAQVNWVFSCTPNQPVRLFDMGNSENGLFQRVLPAILPDRRFEPWEKQKRFSMEDRKMIAEGVEKSTMILTHSTGYYEFENLMDACENWAEEKRQEMIKGNEQLVGLIARPTQILMRYAMLWWLLSGENEPDENSIKFGRMMAEYMVAGQMALLNANIAKKEQTALPVLGYAKNNVFDKLPQHFATDDVQKASPSTTKPESVKRSIRRWKNEGWIVESPTGGWDKV